MVKATWPGCEHFARTHELQLGYFLVFRYDGDAMFTVKMFDNTMCRMYYQHDDDASKLSASLLPVLLASSTCTMTTPCSHFVAFGQAMGAAAGMMTLLWWWRTTTSRWWRRLQSHSLARGPCQLW